MIFLPLLLRGLQCFTVRKIPFSTISTLVLHWLEGSLPHFELCSSHELINIEKIKSIHFGQETRLALINNIWFITTLNTQWTNRGTKIYLVCMETKCLFESRQPTSKTQLYHNLGISHTKTTPISRKSKALYCTRYSNNIDYFPLVSQ